MKFKAGVRLEKLTPQMVLGAMIVAQVYLEVCGIVATITSGSDGDHSPTSLHYEGNALDFRTRDLPPSRVPTVVEKVRDRLGENYDVVFEKDHLHVEYDPE